LALAFIAWYGSSVDVGLVFLLECAGESRVHRHSMPCALTGI
jgi:hypothetical protein